MNNRYSTVTCLIFLFLLSVITQGLVYAKPNFPIIPFDELEAGMKGKGKTVFQGLKVEEFDFEILGVIPNVRMGYGSILTKISGGALPPGLEHYNSCGGMSGSPMYIVDEDGTYRMMGALAWSFWFQKDSLAGVTPIEAMLEIEDHPRSGLLAPKASGARGTNAKKSHLPVFDDPGLMRQMDRPVIVSGFSPKVMGLMTSEFKKTGMAPVAGGSMGLEETKIFGDAKIEPGSSIGSLWIGGDWVIGGWGTVTWVDGDRIVAFGHPADHVGVVNIPITHAYVHYFIASYMDSFKYASLGKVIGAMTDDRRVGVVGYLDQIPPMIPTKIISRRGDQEREYNVQLAYDLNFIGLLTGISMANAYYTSDYFHNDDAVRYSVTMNIRDHGAVALNNTIYSPGNAGGAAYKTLMTPVNAIVHNPFEEIRFDSINMEIESLDLDKIAWIENVRIDKRKAKPGDTISVIVKFVFDRLPPVEKVFAFKLPEDLPQGSYTVGAYDAEAWDALLDQSHFGHRPENLDQLLKRVNQDFPFNRVYLAMTDQSKTWSAQGALLPDLPPNVARVMEKSGMVSTGTYSRLIEKMSGDVPWNILGSGQISLQITTDLTK